MYIMRICFKSYLFSLLIDCYGIGKQFNTRRQDNGQLDTRRQDNEQLDMRRQDKNNKFSYLVMEIQQL